MSHVFYVAKLHSDYMSLLNYRCRLYNNSEYYQRSTDYFSENVTVMYGTGIHGDKRPNCLSV